MSELERGDTIESTDQQPFKRQKLNEPTIIVETDDEEEESEDDEFIECMICSSNWKHSGDHRLASLKCGHLFGQSCIKRWIDDRVTRYGANKAQCPICMEMTRPKEVRKVKYMRIAAEDNSITHKLKEEIDQIKIKMKTNQHILDNAQLALNLCKRELKKAYDKKDVNSVSQRSDSTASQRTAVVNKPLFKSPKMILSSESQHTYRVMEVCTDYEAVVLSYQPNDGTIHGIRKVSLLDMENPEYIPLHSKSIRDIKSSPHQPDLVISTGLDRTLALTSLKSNSKLHAYSLDAPAWSCHVDQHDSNILYCGLVNSNIMVYDIRNSKTHLKSISNPLMTTRSPLHSIQSIRVGDKNALLCSNLINTFLWRDPTDEHSTCTILDVNNNDYHPFSVSTTNNQDSSSSSSSISSTFLISSRKPQSTHHQLIKVLEDSKTETLFSFESPFSQVSLCRTYSFTHDDDIVCCYAEEENNTLCLRNTTQEIQQITLNKSILDVKTFQNQLLLALTDNQLYIYHP